jgi:hypothetical protein
MLPDYLEALLGVSEEALGRLECLPMGAIQQLRLGDADPAGAVVSEGLEPGKDLATRGAEWDAELVHARPLGDPRTRDEFQGFEAIQGDDDRVAWIPQ